MIKLKNSTVIIDGQMFLNFEVTFNGIIIPLKVAHEFIPLFEEQKKLMSNIQYLNKQILERHCLVQTT